MSDDSPPKVSRLGRRLAQLDANYFPRHRAHEETVVEMVSEFFGEPAPLPPRGKIPTPADKAKYLIELLEYFARAYERGDDAQRRLASKAIDDFWQASSHSLAPHVRFTRLVFELAPSVHNAGVHMADLTRSLIILFGVHHSDLAEKLDPELVSEALRCALLDGRKNKGGKTKWQALADAWATTGDKKKPETFKTNWYQEDAGHREREEWLANR